MSLLAIRGLTRRYGPVTALDSVDLDVRQGSRTAIVGPSGSGKSTLLRIVAGFDQADGGTVSLDGQPLVEGPAGVPAHKRGIGIVSQDGSLFPHLSIAENIGFGLDRTVADRNTRIRDMLRLVELDEIMLERRPHQLSGGQQQRVALARALVRRPRLMLLDEPFSALDAGLREQMRRAVARILGEAGITALLVTHDQAEALSFADQVALMRAGRLVQAGTPEGVYFRPRDREAALFLGDAIILQADIASGTATCPLGRISVRDASISRRAEIMLRPEQIRIDAPDGTEAEVLRTDFGGGTWTLILKLLATPDRHPISLRVMGIDPPVPGNRIRLSISGHAHVLEA